MMNEGSDNLIDLLKKLVSIESVNPSLAPSGKGEEEIATFIGDYLSSIGANVKMQKVIDARSNVIGVLQGEEDKGKLLIVAHMDTVGVDSMIIPPFEPTIEGNRLYGRGSADDKSGVAIALEVLTRLSKKRHFKGELIFAATVDEEFEAKGIEKLVADIKADAAIVMEPVDLKIIIAHKGFLWQEFIVKGRAAHGSDFIGGIDAIFNASRLINEIVKLNETLMRKCHPLLGAASLHASEIHGGEGWSTYPSKCILKVERRTLPDETEQSIEMEFDAIVRKLESEGIVIDTEKKFFRPATEISRNERIVQALIEAFTDLGITPQVSGMAPWPEAGVLNLSGIPSVVFGPSGCKGHEAGEFVEIDSVLKCADILERAVEMFFASDRITRRLNVSDRLK